MHNNVNCGHPSGGMTKVIEVKVLKLGKVRSARKRTRMQFGNETEFVRIKYNEHGKVKT